MAMGKRDFQQLKNKWLEIVVFDRSSIFEKEPNQTYENEKKIIEIKNSADKINSRLDTAEENVRKLKDES